MIRRMSRRKRYDIAVARTEAKVIEARSQITRERGRKRHARRGRAYESPSRSRDQMHLTNKAAMIRKRD